MTLAVTVHQMCRRSIKLISLLLTVGSSLLLCPSITRAQVLNENQLKANYILGFGEFIHWNRNNKPIFTIGIVGDTFFAATLESEIAKRNQNHAPKTFILVQVKHIHDLETVDTVYFQGDTQSTWSSYLPRAQSLGILTIADDQGFLAAGGLVRFEIRKNRLGFHLNHEICEAYGFRFSSKLSKLSFD